MRCSRGTCHNLLPTGTFGEMLSVTLAGGVRWYSALNGQGFSAADVIWSPIAGNVGRCRRAPYPPRSFCKPDRAPHPPAGAPWLTAPLRSTAHRAAQIGEHHDQLDFTALLSYKMIPAPRRTRVPSELSISVPFVFYGIGNLRGLRPVRCRPASRCRQSQAHPGAPPLSPASRLTLTMRQALLSGEAGSRTQAKNP